MITLEKFSKEIVNIKQSSQNEIYRLIQSSKKDRELY